MEKKDKLKSKTSSSESTSSRSKYKSFLTSILSPSVSKRNSKKKKVSVQLKTKEDENNSSRVDIDQESIESLYSTIQGTESVSHEGVESNRDESNNSTPKNKVTVVQVEHHSASKSDDIPVYATVKRDDKFLREKLKELTNENRRLRKEVEDFMSNEKRKEETFHAKMKLEITQFEAETLKEVKNLKERIQILLKEKECLNNQIDVLHQEQKSTQLHCSTLKKEMSTMVASSHHNRVVEELRKVLKESSENSTKAINELKQQCDVLEDEKNFLSSQVKDLTVKLDDFQTKSQLNDEEKEKLTQENCELKRQMEVFKQVEIETQALLLSLLKVTEEISMERDVLRSKISLQDYQQKELHAAVVDHSLVIGRLQEHISNLNSDTFQDSLPIKSRFNEAENINLLKQMDIMRSKLREQNTALSEMETEKRKLESQLENVMESFFDKTIIYNT